MEHIISVPKIVHVPATALTIHDPMVVVNQYNEPFIDLMIDTDSAVNLVAWLKPGLSVGEELLVRVLQRAANGSPDTSNQATVDLKTLVPGSLEATQDYNGVFSAAGADATLLRFTSYHSNLAFNGPMFALFYWTGTQWAILKQKLPS